MPSRLARRSGAARLVRSHSRTVPSVMPAARYRASGLKFTLVAYPSAHSRGLPSGVGLAGLVTSHSQIDLSLPLAAIVRPSGLNAALYTYPVGPVSGVPMGRGSVRSWTSSSRTSPVSTDATRVLPSGENATVYTNPPRLLRRDVGASGTPWDRSHSVIDASSEDAARRVPV